MLQNKTQMSIQVVLTTALISEIKPKTYSEKPIDFQTRELGV